jgi:hypothetical protein
MKKTPWFNGLEKPVRCGEYEVYRPGICGVPDHHRLQWNGEGWKYAYSFGPCTEGGYAFMWNGCRWRGPTKEAK